MTYRFVPTTLMLLATLGLNSCNDGVPDSLPGGLGGGATSSLAFDGIWNGGYIGNPPGDPEQWSTTFISMMHEDRLVMFESNGQAWDGIYELTGAATMQTDNVIVYQPTGIRSTRLTINGTTSNTNVLDLNYDLGQGVGLIQMQFGRNAVYDRGSSLSLLSGNWTLVDSIPEAQAEPVTLAINNVNGQAVLDGTNAAGCHYNGVIELISTGRNLYEVSNFVVTDGSPDACAKIVFIPDTAQDGTVTQVPTPFSFVGDDYSGFATLLPDDNTLLFVVANGNNRAVAFNLTRN